jgi:hypothetical protein
LDSRIGGRDQNKYRSSDGRRPTLINGALILSRENKGHQGTEAGISFIAFENRDFHKLFCFFKSL